MEGNIFNIYIQDFHMRINWEIGLFQACSKSTHNHAMIVSGT